jgi:hypothetical protein
VSCGSVVDIVTAYGLDDRGAGVRVPVWSRILTSYRPHRLRGSPNLAFLPGVRRPVREGDRSRQTSADVKKTWICTSTPPCLHGIVVKYRNNFTFISLYETLSGSHSVSCSKIVTHFPAWNIELWSSLSHPSLCFKQVALPFSQGSQDQMARSCSTKEGEGNSI